MLTQIIDDLYHNSVNGTYYHNCKQDFLTEDGSGFLRLTSMQMVTLIDPMRCNTCQKQWESNILDFLLLEQGVKALGGNPGDWI